MPKVPNEPIDDDMMTTTITANNNSNESLACDMIVYFGWNVGSIRNLYRD